jgi:glutamate-ammonia-ligase adenylyltransferase
VGMGKLGGGELNVSSDIDLIFVYPEEGDIRGPRALSNHEFFTRMGKRLIALLAEHTAAGSVFRVDMRLRPWGDPGPLATSFDALEHYLVAQGREWERYAWIKGRAMAGGATGERAVPALQDIVRPFVFRKYLDFGAFGAMRELHEQIRAEVARRELAGHVKLGPGGIREVEFVAQAFQLIRGGRDAALQARPTLQVLALLAKKGLLPQDAVRELSDAYVFLRRVEHRLQYLDDAQTHELPTDAGDQALVAQSMGFATWRAFMAGLDAHRARVSHHFEGVFAADAAPRRRDHALAGLWADPDAAEAGLRKLGYAQPAEAARRMGLIRASNRYRDLPDASRLRFDALVPRLVEAAGTDDAAFTRCLDLLETISRRAAYLALLDEHPGLLARLARLLSASPWAAGYLNQHPILLDVLLDSRALAADPDWHAFGQDLRRDLMAHGADVERILDALRDAHHAQMFHLLAQDLEGRVSVEALADRLSDLADVMLQVTLERCWTLLNGRHREQPRFAVIGYGKLGGKELGYASDLDIIFLYDDDHDAAAELYARLAQRLNNWLTSRTSAGILFDTDLRLRPDGAAGLLVSSMAAFRKYQRESAWVWEKQALTRARFCAGDAGVGAAFEEERRRVLREPRDVPALRAEVLAMRKTMHEGHPNPSKEFDLKHDRGGMVDIEFMVQYLVLAHAHAHPKLVQNDGNIALLGYCAELGLVPAAQAAPVQQAYRELRRRQHALRLNDAKFARVPEREVAAHVAATRALWKTVFGAA